MFTLESETAVASSTAYGRVDAGRRALAILSIVAVEMPSTAPAQMDWFVPLARRSVPTRARCSCGEKEGPVSLDALEALKGGGRLPLARLPQTNATILAVGTHPTHASSARRVPMTPSTTTPLDPLWQKERPAGTDTLEG